MSLFGKLLRLQSDERCRLEDFHTEIVANVLANDPQLTLNWLGFLGVVKDKEAGKVTITTQVNLAAIEGQHDAGSRPDILIHIRNGAHRRLSSLNRRSAQGSALGNCRNMRIIFARFSE